MSTSNKKMILILLIATVLIVFVPLFVMSGAEFGGSDDAGSVMIAEINSTYEPWFAPALETLIGGELPGEVESLLFCLQTGIGVGILAFFLGRMVERKKWEDKAKEKNPY